MPGPMKRVRNALMASPSLEYVDGYGLIAGGRLSFVNVFGKGGHIVAPLSVALTRQAGIELDKTFGDGPGGRVHGGYAIISCANPAYDTRDLRHDFRVEGSRQFARAEREHARRVGRCVLRRRARSADHRRRQVVGGHAGEPGVPAKRDLRERRVGSALAGLRGHHQPLYSRRVRPTWGSPDPACSAIRGAGRKRRMRRSPCTNGHVSAAPGRCAGSGRGRSPATTRPRRRWSFGCRSTPPCTSARRELSSSGRGRRL